MRPERKSCGLTPRSAPLAGRLKGRQTIAHSRQWSYLTDRGSTPEEGPVIPLGIPSAGCLRSGRHSTDGPPVLSCADGMPWHLRDGRSETRKRIVDPRPLLTSLRAAGGRQAVSGSAAQ